MRRLYREFLRKLCKIELKAIGDMERKPTRKELIQWHDMMAISALNKPNQERLLGVMVATSEELEK